ncbi:ATP-binding protein [Pseudonocardia sp. N23]|uniref:sensor histidine kinase n=1 Tax=Pseudonocardia sp. N23 TaxID=1987376 RepID=UPI000BFB5B05|nr:ATP-binding protein [Pseudonocardia sp. N23]GAY13142.1 putative two-component system sensor kinase [Pseudonocardia sp. N23]
MTDRRPDAFGLPFLVAVVAGLCVLGAVLAVGVDITLGSTPRPALLDVTIWSSAVPGAVLVVVGACLSVRAPRHPMTWVLFAGGLLTWLSGVTVGYATWSLLRHGGEWPGTGVVAQFGARIGPLLNLVPPLMLLGFPDGRLPSRRWRVPVMLSLIASAVAVLVAAVVPWHLLGVTDAGVPDEVLPVTLPDDVWMVALSALPWLIATSPVVPALVFMARFRSAGAERRAQLRWMMLAAVVNLALMVVPAVVGPGWATDAAFAVSLVALAAAVLVAVTRHRLYEIDVVVGRVLVYGVLAATVIALDLAVFLGAGAALGDPMAAVVAAGVVAVAYAPLRSRIERVVARFAPGRIEPYAVVADLADRLERAGDPAAQLADVARTVAMAVSSPYVRVELDRADGATVTAESGHPSPDVVVLPFAYREVPIGRLALVAPAVTPPRARQRLMADVVRQSAVAVRSAALADELQRSREELVTRVAEERRRLRRDLHDGLGPLLAAAALKTQAAANLAATDVAAARATLDLVGEDLAAAVAGLRRVTHLLRPPALDQLGLDGALRRLAGRFGGATDVQVETVGGTDALPAAVEEAAYHIVAEALANAVRHAAPTRVRVCARTAGERLEVVVADDGVGIPDGAHSGVGLVSLRERAEELGGRVTIGAAPQGGTLVRAVLPCHPAGRDAPSRHGALP